MDIFEGHWLGCLLARTRQWNAKVVTSESYGRQLIVRAKHRETTVDLFNIHRVTLDSGLFFSRITLIGQVEPISLLGISKQSARSAVALLEQQIIEEVDRRLESAKGLLELRGAFVAHFLTQDRCLRHSDVTRFKAVACQMLDATIKTAFELLSHPYVQDTVLASAVRQKAEQFSEKLRLNPALLQRCNELFVIEEPKNHHSAFDALEKTPLTEAQRRAVVVFEDQNILWSTRVVTSESYGRQLIIKTKHRETTVDLFNIHRVTLDSGRFFSRITLIGQLEPVCLLGISKQRARSAVASLEQQIIEEVDCRLESAKGLLELRGSYVRCFLTQDRYLRHSDVERFKATACQILDATTKTAFELLEHPYARHTVQASAVRQKAEQFSEILQLSPALLQRRNEYYVIKELKTYHTFFDAIEKTPLTDEQRRAVVIFEDRNLLVAAAGSGKSSTLIGKVGYAIKKGLFQPKEILILAFNRDAALELNQRINVRIDPWLNGQIVKAYTFHQLGTVLVRKVAHDQGRRIYVASEIEEKTRLHAVLNELNKNEPFSSDWVALLSLCRAPVPADDAFNSIDDYNRYVDRQRKAKRNGDSAVFQTLAGPVVRSAEELAIANWLYIQGVPFEYEKLFEPLPDGWGKYQPDFYYPEINTWHEHFALNVRGEAPAHFADYARNAEIKRKWLSAHVRGQWFETRSHQYREGGLFDALKMSLIQSGQVFRPRTSKQILACIQRLGQTDIIDLLLRVLRLVKGNCITPASFERCVEAEYDIERARKFSKVFWPLYTAYNRRLSQEGKIDFDDMIVQAAEILEQRRVSSPFKLILVDEFQDLSPGRARLLHALLASHKDSVLFGVGDDWQAINGFAGADLRLFMDFEPTFGPTYEGALTKVFRSAQGVAEVGAFFVQQNKKGQKKKRVISELDKTINGMVDLLDLKNDSHVATELDNQLAELAASHFARYGDSPAAQKTTVFLLSRYGLSKTAGIHTRWLDEVKARFEHALIIEFITINKSKGLEADYVFVLGLNAGWGLSFPSAMTNDPLVDMLLTQHDPFPYAEERRLFYVALTRAKKRAAVLFKRFSPSPFVLELMAPHYQGRVTFRKGALPECCNVCGKGFLALRSGPYGSFFGCTRYSPTNGCKNTRPVSKPDPLRISHA